MLKLILLSLFQSRMGGKTSEAHASDFKLFVALEVQNEESYLKIKYIMNQD